MHNLLQITNSPDVAHQGELKIANLDNMNGAKVSLCLPAAIANACCNRQGLFIGEQLVRDLIAERPIGFELGLGEKLLGCELVRVSGILSTVGAHILRLFASD